jgi:hypothetical protein
MVSRKSAASRPSACERRNCAQVVAARSGAGSMPATRRISHTVDAATLIPRVSSSPCTRRYPQDGFSGTKRSTSTRIERTVGGRPRRQGREAAAWRRASRSRCQRKTVSGRTSSRKPCRLGRGSRCSSPASHARSAASNRTRCPSSCRCGTASWCRGARVSASLSRSLPGRSRSNANAFVTPRYASRNSTRQHPRVVTDDDGEQDN